MTDSELIDVIKDLARQLPAPHVEGLADAVEQYGLFEEAAVSSALGATPIPAVAHHADRLVRAWRRSPEVPGIAVAMALRAASSAAADERESEKVEIAWTGPKTSAVPVRLTRQVLLEIIEEVARELWIVSFAAYRVDDIVAALKAAAARGAAIRLVLEMEEAEGGTLSFGAAGAFDELRGVASFLAWPLDRRPALEKGRAALHAKAAIADERLAFVTSANLTGHALSQNMELGLLVRGGNVPKQLAVHFRRLLAAGILSEIG